MMDFNSETEFMNEQQPFYVVFIARVGKDMDGQHIYRMLLSDSPNEVWGEQWSEKPACICRDISIDESMYTYKKEFKTDVNLVLGQESCCGSMQDVKDRCFTLAYENLDGYEEYPTLIRLVFHYGEPIESVEEKLLRREIRTYFV